MPVLWREHQMWHILQMSLSSLVTWCSWWLHGMLSTFFCCASCLLSSNLLSAAGSPVTPNAPPSALTTSFACSRAWSIIICETVCSIYTQWHLSSELKKPSEVVSVTSYCRCRGQEYIVDNLHCFWQISMVAYQYGQWLTVQIKGRLLE